MQQKPIELTVKAFAAREQVTVRTVWHWIEKGAVQVRRRRTCGGGVRVIVLAIDEIAMQSTESERNPSA